MLEAGTPRIAEHALEYADNLRTNIGLAGFVRKLKWVESDGVSSVGGIKVDDVLDARLRNKTEIIDGEIAVRVNNAIALIIKDVGKSKKL